MDALGSALFGDLLQEADLRPVGERQRRLSAVHVEIDRAQIPERQQLPEERHGDRPLCGEYAVAERPAIGRGGLEQHPADRLEVSSVRGADAPAVVTRREGVVADLLPVQHQRQRVRRQRCLLHADRDGRGREDSRRRDRVHESAVRREDIGARIHRDAAVLRRAGIVDRRIEGHARRAFDVRPDLAVRGALPLERVSVVPRGQRRLQGDGTVVQHLLHDRSDRSLQPQVVRKPHHALGAELPQIINIIVPCERDAVLQRVLARAEQRHRARRDQIIRAEGVRAPAGVVHQSGRADQRLLAVRVAGEVLKIRLVLVIDLRHALHEVRMLAELLQEAHGLVHGEQPDAVVVPALRVELHRLGDADEEFVQRPPQRDVIVPRGPGDQLVVLGEPVAVHEDVARVAVIGLCDLVHQEHLHPGIEIEVIQIPVGIILRQGGKGLVEIRLDVRLIDALLRGVVSDVLDIDAVVLQQHVVHALDLELIGLLRDVVVVEHEAVLRGVIVLLRREQIVAEELPVHPDVHKARFHPDAELVRQIHGDLVAQERVVQIVRQQRPLLRLHARDELGVVLLGIVVFFVEGDVVGLLAELPGGVAAPLHADGLVEFPEHRSAVALGLVVGVAVHGADRAEALVELQEHRLHALGALQRLDRHIRECGAAGDFIRDALVHRRDGRFPAGIHHVIPRHGDAGIVPRKTELGGVDLSGQIQRAVDAERVKAD